MDQNTQQGDSAFVPGLRMFRPDNAPNWVLGKLTITIQDLINYINQNPQILSSYNGQSQLQVDLLWSKAGKPYCKLNTYGTAAAQQGAPAAPPAPQAPAGYQPAQPQQGYPQQAPAPKPQQQYPPVQQPYGPYPQQGAPTAPQAPAAPPAYPQQPAPPAGYPPAQAAPGTTNQLPF